ncbi:MAG: MFS transporter [Candidatus Bathyarchaeota archaeon]|nr:MFS transporter [Candidatus Bathyarchaeota archaeon]
MKKPSSDQLQSLIYLAAGYFSINFALAINSSISKNFFVNELHFDAFQIGTLESIREIPGLLSAFIMGSILQFPPSLLAGVFLLIFSVGIGGVSTVNSWIHVVPWLLIWSIGFHSWVPLSSSLTLSLSETAQEGKRLGQVNSVASIAAIIAMAAVTIFSSIVEMPYRLFFVIAGSIALIGGLIVVKIPSTKHVFNRTRIVFRRQYGVFYILSFFEGARRQMFVTFAPFALVSIYGLDVTTMALVMVISRVLTFLSSPYLGKLTDRFGSKTMLTVSYVLMIVNFLGYALLHDVFVLLALYVLNTILMIISRISRTTYIHELAPRADLTPSLAMGQTTEHIAAVIMPFTGGIIWGIFGYEVTFFIGVACATCLLVTAQKIYRKPPR